MLTYFDPHFDGYHYANDDDDDYVYPYSFYSPMTMREREWRHRRELEYMRQQQQQQEVAARRREHELRRAYQEQKQKLRQENRHGLHSQPIINNPVVVMNEDPGALESYRVVQGPNGRLYRLPVRRQDRPVSKSPRQQDPRYIIMRAPDGSLFRVPAEHTVVDNQQHESMMHQGDDEVVSEMEHVVEKHAKPTKPLNDPPSQTKETLKDGRIVEKPPKKRRSKVTVIVEDASDSEYEGDELNSVWRNRRPSPGQWMEPVEY